MDQRGHQLPDSSRRSHRTKDKEHFSRFTQQEWDLNHPLPDQRWAPPDAHYMTHFTSPPARPQPFPYHSQEYAYGYGWQEHHRPQSRSVLFYISKNTLQVNIKNVLLNAVVNAVNTLYLDTEIQKKMLSELLDSLFVHRSVAGICQTLLLMHKQTLI